jgi:hypothetical protein
MKLHPVLGAAIALALCARGAPAQMSPAPALPVLTPPAVATTVTVASILAAPGAIAGLDFGLCPGTRSAAFGAPVGWYGPRPGLYAPRYAGLMYRPRRYGMHPWRRGAVMYQPRQPVSPPPRVAPGTPPRETSRASNAMPVPVQIHGGVFAHEQNGPRSYAFGLRGGPSIDPHVQIGLGADWYHRTESERAVVAETLQAGQPVTKTRVLSQASSDLIPVMAFLQLSAGKGLIPYAGIAGQYQFLLLSATDYATGAGYNANFGGLGWQAWGGLALAFGRSHLFGEVFISTGDVERDVSDPAGVGTYRETVNADGGGARFGLSWGF